MIPDPVFYALLAALCAPGWWHSTRRARVQGAYRRAQRRQTL